MVGQVLLVCSVLIHDVDISPNTDRGEIGTFKRDAATVGRPRGIRVVVSVIRQVCRFASVRVHDVDLGVTGTGRPERDTAPVGRPTRTVVPLVVVGQVRCVRAIRVHDIDLVVAIAVGHERDTQANGLGKVCVITVHVDRRAIVRLLVSMERVVGVAATRGQDDCQGDQPGDGCSEVRDHADPLVA